MRKLFCSTLFQIPLKIRIFWLYVSYFIISILSSTVIISLSFISFSLRENIQVPLKFSLEKLVVQLTAHRTNLCHQHILSSSLCLSYKQAIVQDAVVVCTMEGKAGYPYSLCLMRSPHSSPHLTLLCWNCFSLNQQRSCGRKPRKSICTSTSIWFW